MRSWGSWRKWVPNAIVIIITLIDTVVIIFKQGYFSYLCWYLWWFTLVFYFCSSLLFSSSTNRHSTGSVGGVFTPPNLQEEPEPEEVSMDAMEIPSSPSPPSQRKRRTSTTSASSISKPPRYASSPPLLVPEIDDSVGRFNSPILEFVFVNPL